KGARPLEFVGAELVRRLLGSALGSLTRDQMLDLFPRPGLGKWTRRLGLGSGQAQEKTQWLLQTLDAERTTHQAPGSLHSSSVIQRLREGGVEPERAFELLCSHIERTEPHNTAGLMRRNIYQGFARATLLGDEAELASFLTYGFAELEFQVRPTRQDLVLALFKALLGILQGLHVPVVVAFDQLEDLLLARRTDDVHRIAEAFFA